MSDLQDRFSALFTRLVAGLGAVTAAAAVVTGLCYVVGSVYLGSYLARFGAEWALEISSPQARLSSGWLPLLAVVFLIGLNLGTAFERMPAAGNSSRVVRWAGLTASLAMSVHFLIGGFIGLPAWAQLILFGVFACSIVVIVAGLSDLIIHGLSRPDPFEAKPLAGQLVTLTILSLVVFPWAAGQTRALWHHRFHLQSLPLVEYADSDDAPSQECRVVLVTEERLLCTTSEGGYPKRVVLVPWSDVSAVVTSVPGRH